MVNVSRGTFIVRHPTYGLYKVSCMHFATAVREILISFLFHCLRAHVVVV